ncbi:hypothetical protein PR202_ga00278 [Eleusine coracana subsp. coracana]|uniref:Alpha-ketoglutarate-dependent dioxygenase AlkB-like domain-containing protein n=1 Tax=Eleusine coracana subsp. coracana TaxID=191504 RepID=A0AAV5BH14_ELECO|nr:hypothetical protein PR202_ga00278 [Eleusine coracana subsp. coracana]
MEAAAMEDRTPPRSGGGGSGAGGGGGEAIDGVALEEPRRLHCRRHPQHLLCAWVRLPGRAIAAPPPHADLPGAGAQVEVPQEPEAAELGYDVVLASGGVVHEKGLLPQALPPWLIKITDRICQWTDLFPSAINHVLINEYHPDQGIMPHQDGPAYYPVVAILSLASPVVIDFTPHQRLRGQEHTDPQNLQSNELQTPPKMESNGSHELEGTSESDTTSSLLLMPGSLLIFKDQAYTDYLHGIQDSELHNLNRVANMSQCPELKYLNSGCNQGIFYEQSGTFRRTATRVWLTCRLVLKVHKKLFKI